MKHKKVSKKAVNSSTGNIKPAYDQMSKEFGMSEDGQRTSKRTEFDSMSTRSNRHSRNNSSSSQRTDMSEGESNFDCNSSRSDVKSGSGSRSPSRESISHPVNNIEEFESMKAGKIKKPQSIEENKMAFKQSFQKPDELKFYLNSQGLHSNESILHFHDLSSHKFKLFNQLYNDVRLGYTNGLVNPQSNQIFRQSKFLNNDNILNSQELCSQEDLNYHKNVEHETYN